jgi:hypothetical protein
MQENTVGSITNTYEEVYLGYEIYVEPNRDPYREGFEWSVCKEDSVIDNGLAFTIPDSVDQARKVVDAATK